MNRTLRRHVLVVDDQDEARFLIAYALHGTGRYDVEQATSAREALTRLGEDDYGALVVDVDMQDMDGMELSRKIRARPQTAATPIVLTTPPGSTVDEQAAKLAGATCLIRKPFQPRDLTRLLDELTEAVPSTEDALSVESVMSSFPYPAMVLGGDHAVVMANGAFYDATGTGLGECFVACFDMMHADRTVPRECPLDEAARTGMPAERTVTTVLGSMRVSVYPLSVRSPDGKHLFLHVTQPAVGDQSLPGA